MNGVLASKLGRQIARRLSWGVADQAVSSLQNFLLGVYVARSLGAAGLGVFGLALVVYTIVVNASRALSTDPLMIRFSGAAESAWPRAVASSGGVAALVGLAGGAVCVVFGIVLYAAQPELGGAFVALGIALPALTLQDSWRYAFFAAGEGCRAVLNDGVRAVSLGVTLAVGALAGLSGIPWTMLAFGGSALFAALFGMLQTRIVPMWRNAGRWLRQHRDLGPRFLVENVVLGADDKLRMFVIAATVGLGSTGAIRGAEMLVGPVAALLMGIGQVAVPEAARALRRGRVLQLCLTLSGGLAVAAVLWGLTILLIFPMGMGGLVLGTVWSEAYQLALAVVVSMVAGCLHVGPSAGLRALGRADKTMPCQLTVSGLLIVLSCGGAFVWGAIGAVWATAIAAIIGAGIWWQQLVSAHRAYHLARSDASHVHEEHSDVVNRK